MTGRKVPADEAFRIGACERIVPNGQAREGAEELAKEIARFPQRCMNADRRSVYLQHGLSVEQAMRREWTNSVGVISEEGISGAERFKSGRGRHGEFDDI